MSIERRAAGESVWLRRGGADDRAELRSYTPHSLSYEVLESEEAVGLAMLDEIETAARSNFIKTEIAAEAETRARQLDENPGLWIRLNPNVDCWFWPMC